MKKEKKEEIPSGWFRFKNIMDNDLLLNNPTRKGKTMIKSGEVFEGDSRHLCQSGLLCVKNLCHFLKKKEKPVQEHVEEKKELLIETPPEGLQFYESDGSEIKNETEEEEKTEIPLTRKELIEFAEFKGIKLPKNLKKEQMLERIREHKNKK